ncbi:hypothetical protein [Pseudomonas tohonis]|uniref:hypothetical protein n=1 Tax=Pseudomonas tohonis TaxID=2725477 RepID=UPI0015631B62|nr:hypothetical protein [Pseudomonas tohonis]
MHFLHSVLEAAVALIYAIQSLKNEFLVFNFDFFLCLSGALTEPSRRSAHP